MPAFEDVVPFFLWGLVGFAVILGLVFLGRMIGYFRRAAQDIRGEDRAAEREREGPWYYIAELFRLGSVVIVLVVGYTILNYLFLRPPDVNLYHAVFDDWPMVVIVLIIAYYAVKIVGELAARGKDRQMERQEQEQRVEE